MGAIQAAGHQGAGRGAIHLALACLALVSSAASADAQMVNLITNGGFETTNFSGWNVGSTQTQPFTAALSSGNTAVVPAPTGFSWVIRNQPAAYWGSPNIAMPITGFSAFNGFDGSPGDFFLRQGITLTQAPASAILDFDYAVQSSYSGQVRTFSVNILDQTGTTQLANVFSYPRPTGDLPAWNPVHVQLDVTNALDLLGAGAYQLEFKINIPANYTGPAQFAIDNISLNVSTVPEPSSVALIGLGLAGMATVVYRQRKRAASSPAGAQADSAGASGSVVSGPADAGPAASGPDGS